MTTHSIQRPVWTPEPSVIRWLLEGDPSIRWQVMRDLTDEPAEVVAIERAKVATKGLGAQLLALQRKKGHWGSDDANPEFITLLTLLRLRELGLDPASKEARRAVGLVHDNVTWNAHSASWNGRPLFSGEVEPCINGRVVTVGAYFGQDVQGIVERLIGEQMSDGGWNCEQERGSIRGSFHTTICVLEGLREHERATGSSSAVTAALARGQEYLLQRRLLRRLSTGEVIDPAWTQISFPTGYQYDILRGLDYLRSAGVPPDARMVEAIDLVASKRDADGRWPLQNVHSDHLVGRRLDAGEGAAEGQPSRWNTLRALRVLDWYSARD